MSKINIQIKNNIRAYFIDMTEVIQKAMDMHKTTPLASLSLGSVMSTFGILGFMKQSGKSTVIVNGDGALGSIIVDSNSDGEIRATIANPQVSTEADNADFNNLPISLGIGTQGEIKVVQNNNEQNFTSEIKIVKGNMTTDLAYYFDQSEQVNSAIISSVILETPNKLLVGKSVIFQMLPEHTEEDILWLETFINNHDFVKTSLEDYINTFEGNAIGSKSLSWKCSCSPDKMQQIVATLTPLEKEEIMSEHRKIEIKCNFCREEYDLTN